MFELTRFLTADASPDRLREIRTLLDRVFGEKLTEDDWAHALGGWHIVVDERTPIAHAAVVERTIEVAGRPFRTGYVEAVATDPSRRHEGHGTAVMAEVARIIRAHFDLGALSTGLRGFYEGLGWERWQGPSYVRTGAGLHRTADEDEGLMVLRFGPSRDVDLSAPISCEPRRGDDW